MSHLDQLREHQADEYRGEILSCGAERAAWIADYLNVPLTIVLRVLVPRYRQRGLLTKQIAWELGVTMRTVDRHLARARSIAGRKLAA
jgi:hypothetical protein